MEAYGEYDKNMSMVTRHRLKSNFMDCCNKFCFNSLAALPLRSVIGGRSLDLLPGATLAEYAHAREQQPEYYDTTAQKSVIGHDVCRK